MAFQRTTILLDNETRQAARELALRFGCSTSEAIRRAILNCRDQQPRYATLEERQRRTGALHELFRLFDGHDAQAEIDELKRNDDAESH